MLTDDQLVIVVNARASRPGLTYHMWADDKVRTICGHQVDQFEDFLVPKWLANRASGVMCRSCRARLSYRSKVKSALKHAPVIELGDPR